MAVVLLDTDVVSFILKADTRADLYMPHLEGQTLALCFMTVAELFQWAAVRKWGASRTGQLEMMLQKYVVLPFDFALCRRWGEIRAGCRATGQPISLKMPGLPPARCIISFLWSLITLPISLG